MLMNSIMWQSEALHCVDVVNGSQLAKMKKYIPHMSLPWNLKGRSGWSKKFQLKNYDFCEYVQFGAISLKNDIL